MARTIVDLRLSFDTAADSPPGPAVVEILLNGIPLPLHPVTGSTGPGDRFVGEFRLSAIVSSLALKHRCSEPWRLSSLEVEAMDAHQHRWCAHHAGVTLRCGETLDLLAGLPTTMDV